MSRSICWILLIGILLSSNITIAYNSNPKGHKSKSDLIKEFIDPERRTKYRDPDKIVGYRPVQRYHLKYIRPNLPMLTNPEDVFYRPRIGSIEFAPMWFDYSKEPWPNYTDGTIYPKIINNREIRSLLYKLTPGMNRKERIAFVNRYFAASPAQPPQHRFHLSDLIYDHQNSVGELYLILNQPTPPPTPPPVQMPAQVSTQAPKEEPKSSVIVLSPAELPRPAPTPRPFGEALNEARKNFQAGLYSEAAKGFEAAAQSQPENPVVYMGLMFSYLGNREYAKAAATLHQALALHEEWYKTPMNLALLRVSPAEFQSLIQEMEQTIGDNTQDEETHFLLGYCYFIAGNKDKAKATIDSLIQQKPNYKELMKLSQSFNES